MGYIDSLNEETKQYYKILSKDIPNFIEEYVNTPAMLRLKGISMLPGVDWTNIIKLKYFNSRLDHSIGVALIIWNFTKDKKQTLAGLFHDISTPSFSHIVDFMHEDYLKQESTEELTKTMIEQSAEIMSLLKRDNIQVEDVYDYHRYPIADNDTPLLSADRLEYTFSDGLMLKNAILTLEQVQKMYENLTILKNEEDQIELGFQDIKMAEEFIVTAKPLWEIITQKNEFKVIMQFWADYFRKMQEHNQIKEQDLYQMSEQEIIQKIKQQKNQKMLETFNQFEKANKLERTQTKVNGKYCISLKTKRRYINPLVQRNNETKRVIEVSEKANKIVEDVLSYEDSLYGYLDISDFRTI